jgi:hypothetical protein
MTINPSFIMILIRVLYRNKFHRLRGLVGMLTFLCPSVHAYEETCLSFAFYFERLFRNTDYIAWDRTIPQAVSRLLPTVAARVLSQVSSCGTWRQTKRHWGKFSPSASDCSANTHFSNCIASIYHPVIDGIYCLDTDSVVMQQT